MGKPMKTYLTERFHRELEKVLSIHNGKAYGRDGQLAPRRNCSLKTQRDRKSFYALAFGQLKELGYNLENPSGLKEKHVHALAKRWLGEGIAARTLHTRMSMLRVLVGWIGKPGMVKDNSVYFPAKCLQRTSIATRNHAWAANGVNPQDIIEKAHCLDERFGLMLEFQHHFGLRVKESMELLPLRAVSADGQHLMVIDGTKGGLPRLVPIRTEQQRELIVRAQQVVGGSRSKKRLRWDDKIFTEAQSRFYWLMRKLGITREESNVTAHGLRHGYAQARGREESGGLPTPIEGGAIGRIDGETHRKASQTVSLELGHRRPTVVSFYYGSYGHSLRDAQTLTKRLNAIGIGV